MFYTPIEKVSPTSDKTEKHSEQADNSEPGVAPLPVEEEEADVSTWSEYRLHPKLIDGIRHLKFTTPTEIQKQAIPVALASKDVVAAAETVRGRSYMNPGSIGY